MKLAIFKHNDVYSARLSNGVCLQVSEKNFRAQIVEEIFGKPLPPYPKDGWSNPPLMVMHMFELAELVATTGNGAT